MDSKELKRRYGKGDRHFQSVQLQKANLAWIDLSGANFSTANFQGATLSGAALKGVNFSGADLSSTDLSRADLTCANLCGANLKGTNLEGATLTDARCDSRTQFPFGFDIERSGVEIQPQDLPDPPPEPPKPPIKDKLGPTSPGEPLPPTPEPPDQGGLKWVAFGAAIGSFILGVSVLKGANSKLPDPQPPIQSTIEQRSDTKLATMTEAEAIALLEQWSVAKAAAMGKEHDTTQLYQVLTLPALAQWQYSADQVKALGGYWIYTPHQVSVQAILPVAREQIVLKAMVSESAEYYAQGKHIPEQSATDTYPMEFTIVRQGQRWLIQDLKILR